MVLKSEKLSHTCLVTALHTVVGVVALAVQPSQEAQGRLAQAHDFYGTAITGRRWLTLCAGQLTRSHLVHPSATVVYRAAIHKTCSGDSCLN